MGVVSDDVPEKGPRDRALILGELAEQKGLAILRQRDENAPVEAGVVRKVREGEPIVGELVSLTPAAESSRDLPLCDVKVHVDTRALTGDARPAAHKGPPRVASESYRSGWDALFGSDEPVDERLLN